MPETTVATRPCVVCGATARSLELRISEWEVLRCAPCGLRTLSPAPAPEQLVEPFEDGSGYEGAFDLRDDILKRHDRSLGTLERVVPPGRLLDVGCGPGFLLEAARDRGWEAVGLDPSPFSVARAIRLGFEAHGGRLEDARLPAASFDAVGLLQVIEHVLDPRPLLAACRRVLRPGGALLVATPNPASLLARVKRERFNYWIPPLHCVWYTPGSLRRVLASAGFAPVMVRTWSARARTLHDGEDILANTRAGRLLPRRARRAAGTLVAAATDAAGRGSIVEAVAVRRDDR